MKTEDNNSQVVRVGDDVLCDCVDKWNEKSSSNYFALMS